MDSPFTLLYFRASCVVVIYFLFSHTKLQFMAMKKRLNWCQPVFSVNKLRIYSNSVSFSLLHHAFYLSTSVQLELNRFLFFISFCHFFSLLYLDCCCDFQELFSLQSAVRLNIFSIDLNLNKYTAAAAEKKRQEFEASLKWKMLKKLILI